MIRSLGDSWSECGGGLGEKSGGVEGAVVCMSQLDGGKSAFVVSWWLQGRFAVMEVKDCEKEKTCRPSMWVKNSGKKKFSCWALARALCRTANVRGRNWWAVTERRSSRRSSVQSVMYLAMLNS